jgi:hypothetical protein
LASVLLAGAAADEEEDGVGVVGGGVLPLGCVGAGRWGSAGEDRGVAFLSSAFLCLSSRHVKSTCGD